MDGTQNPASPAPAAEAEDKTDVNMVVSETTAKIEFSYVWTINDFMRATDLSVMKSGQFLRSPPFAPIGAEVPQEWCLFVYPNGYEKWDSVISILLGLRTTLEAVDQASFVFSFFNESKRKTCSISKDAFSFLETPTGSPMSVSGPHQWVGRDQLISKKNVLLPHNNLTIVCDVKIVYNPHFRRRGEIKTPPFKIPDCRMTNDYAGLFENPKLSDLTIVVDDREIFAHTTILAARSSVFASILAVKSDEPPRRMDVYDTSYEVFTELLRYIYCGEVTKMEKLADRLLVSADKYNLVRLKALCEKSLSETISVENAGRLLNISGRYNANQLKHRLFDFISRHTQELKGDPEFAKAVLAHPDLLLEAFSCMAERDHGELTV